MEMQDRVAIVAGAGPGLGRATALALAREGAAVVLGARSEDRLKEIAAEVEDAGGRAAVAATDVRDAGDCEGLVATAVDTFGRLDVLVGNAFVHPRMVPMEETEHDDWARGFDVNVQGAVRMAQAATPVMRNGGGGAMVFVSSMSAHRVNETFGTYAATKSALITAAQHLALELGPDGIRVNCVAPGFIWGPSVEWWFEHLAEQRGVDPQVIYDEHAEQMALRRLATSEDVAEAIVFLASDRARAITGETLDVNAGQWFH